MPTFGTTEHDITNLFPIGGKFDYDGHRYSVINSGKPKPPRGECKTDTYVLAVDESGANREFKISIKQPNAEFLEKRDCKVNNRVIPNSGVANMFLVAEPGDNTLDKVLPKLKTMEDFIRTAPSTVYFACKALNYRLEDGKWDGDRPLAVYVKWEEIDGKLDGKLVMDKPLEVKGNEVGENVKKLVDGYGINKDNFDEIAKYLSDNTSIYK